ncbi:RNA polymerase sigma factor [Georgenia sp. SYP-B2076]|uniref:RNA polymerase sigma factor n=1 Tax=Georgenia sp. SYP-B2076 TaxID=2495881 RepID=UPI000F8DCFCE|nr:sigma-70 family RNA polymerase sigma factor [Georgenia sp. SYP-B2076]
MTRPLAPSLADLPDAVLARRAALRDHAAFGVIVDRHGPALYRYSYRMLQHHSDTQDCLQEVLVAAWRGLPAFRGDAELRTWLFALAINQVRTFLRRRPPSTLPVEELQIAAPGRSDPEQHALATDLLSALDRALRELPLSQRSTWLLVEIEGLSYAEVAEIRHTTVDAVRGQLHRARQSLETRLEGWR